MPGLENTAPRIQSDFKPKHHDVIQGHKQKLLRKERRIKRLITVVLGYALMAWMIYLIIVTARNTPKIWDPYDILGISRVRLTRKEVYDQEEKGANCFDSFCNTECNRETD